MRNIQGRRWAGEIEVFQSRTRVPEHRYSRLNFGDKSELNAGIEEEIAKLHASSKEESKQHAYFQVDIYGDLQFSEPNLNFANFYAVGSELMLGLQTGHETADSKGAVQDNASPSSYSHDDAGVDEPAAMSSTTPYYSARIQDLMDLRSTKYVTAPDDVEFDIEASKSTWTQLDPNDDVDEAAQTTDDDLSDDDGGGSNQEEFDRLKEHPEWGPFFRNNQYSHLKLGALLGKGSQATVYEAIDIRPDSREKFVVKVFEKGFRLCKLQKWWPQGLVEAANSQRYVFNVPYVCWALGAQLLEDDRFAFVFPKLNCDLRKRIDDAMRTRNGIGPPFSPSTCFCIISDIAAGMAYLHNRNMLHHDLKAANVLDMRNVCEDQRCIMLLIADFESSVGIMGTRFWRAPEILSQLRARPTSGPRKAMKFSKESDVFSFAMTCYEVITGRLPFEGRSPNDVDGVIGGERPVLPPNICPELRDLICRCWSLDPFQRPSFNTIRTDLIEIGKMQSKTWNIHIRYKLLHSVRPGKISEEKKGLKDIDWEWPIYDQQRIKGGVERKVRETETEFRNSLIFENENKILRLIPASETKEDKPDARPFEVTFEQEGPMPDTVTIKLHSPDLIQVAKQCLPLQQEQFTMEKPKINSKDMFIALQAFRDAYQSIQHDVDYALKTKFWELKHLLRFLETHYKDTTPNVERLRREKKVSFDLLWAFLYRGEKVHYTCQMTGQTLLGVVTVAYYQKSRKNKEFIVRLECRDYNGWEYMNGSVKFPVDEFNGEKSFYTIRIGGPLHRDSDSIGICPIRLLEQSEVIEAEAMVLQSGRKFYNIVAQGSTYMQYVGTRHLREEDNFGDLFLLTKQKADGRVMVDLLSFARTNPHYPLKNAKPPAKRIARIGPCGDVLEMPSDEDLMLAPAVVYGFSFSNKQWGGFDINGFSEIHFDDQAFDRDLVLTDPNRKEILLPLVTEYLKDPASADDDMVPRIDPISNKGSGCIFLCFGPPGTGKTLTAESIAEKLHRPFWSISVFELGIEAKDFEEKLITILDIAFQWRAVLLLDEADVYLEKRTSNGNPKRAAITAIFLRLLEYYRGVLFLTTNRVASFDDAFCSRISMFLRYHRLSVVQREAIWSNLLSRAQIQNPDLKLFRDYQLNGREIRNCIRIAQALARSSGEELTTSHVLKVVNMPVGLRQDLEDAIMEETDERSITRVLGRVDCVAESTLNSTIPACS